MQKPEEWPKKKTNKTTKNEAKKMAQNGRS